MTQFQQRYPELEANPPLMPGEEAQAHSPLHSMRRQQLHDLARGWVIEVPNGGTKEEILPALIAAERAGVFKRPAIHPEFARKASRNSDEPPLPRINPVAQPVATIEPEMPDNAA